jgi:hypothetical protein
MSVKPVIVDEAPVSEFIAKMRACFQERLAAADDQGKRDVEGRMRDIMRQYLGRSAWQGFRAARRATVAIPLDPRRCACGQMFAPTTKRQVHCRPSCRRRPERPLVAVATSGDADE